ncbi:MAG: YncE family protein [Phycisphaerae bacterium]
MSRRFPLTLSALALLALPAVAQTGFFHWETPHVSPLALTPSGDVLLAVNTADNRLEVFDVSGGTPVYVRSVAVGLDPVSVRARSESEIWVVNHVSDTISIVDLPSGRVVRALPTGDEPTDVVFAGSPPRAFVSVSQLNQVRVFDLANLGAPPAILSIQGEDPRMLAASADGRRVFAAIFESANTTTAIRQQDVSNPNGPFAGRNPPPNQGNLIIPAPTPGLPPPPPVAHIVRRDAAGAWRDDNGANWSAFVTWNLVDHDVAIIDADTLGVSYATGMLSSVMGVSVRPDGVVTAFGLDASNERRFEPNIQAVFARVLMGVFDPATPATRTQIDLNPHLNYSIRSVPLAQRELSLGDPRAMTWHPTAMIGYVAGMGSNNVIVIDPAGARLGQIDVGEGPTGLALSAAGDRLYVLNKFEATISAIDTATNSEVVRVGFFDPTPAAIKLGRPLLYNTHTTSGLGHLSCASCHVDARTDHLGWDLGNPAGQMKAFNQACRQPVCDDWHPMKGPMVTQSLQGIIGVEPLHWRGDREDLAAFAPAFVGLQGADAEPSPAQMQQFTAFIATVRFPPNPFRNLDNTLPTAVPSSLGGTGNAAVGLNIYNTLATVGPATCRGCHGPFPGPGTNRTIDDPPNLPLAPQPLKMAQLRNMHEKTGWDRASQQSNRGFGFNHHSDFGTMGQFLSGPFAFAPGPQGQQQRRDVEALMMSWASDTHAGVGQQVMFDGFNNNDPTLVARSNLFVNLATGGQIGLVAKGVIGGVPRGWVFNRDIGVFLADRVGEQIDINTLRNSAAPGGEIAFTLVPIGTQRRIGIDRDVDGFLDFDEHDAGSDPADPASTPNTVRVAGDLNCDGVVDNFDIDAFVLALTQPAVYDTLLPDCTRNNANINGDAFVDNFDIDPFVALLVQ